MNLYLFLLRLGAVHNAAGYLLSEMLGCNKLDVRVEEISIMKRKKRKKFRPFGIHYCGNDPHRYAEAFHKIENLDFPDVGWGGDG